MIRTATGLKVGFVIAILMLVLNMLVPFFGARWVNAALIEHDRQEQLGRHLQQLLSGLKDGETGQRGFVITGREDYLTPLYQGFGDVDRLYQTLSQSLDDEQLLVLHSLRPLIDEQRDYFTTSIETRRNQGLVAASERISSGKGKQLMDGIRARVDSIQQATNQNSLLSQQEIAWREGLSRAVLILVAVLDLLVIALLFHFTFRALHEGREGRRQLQSLSEQLANGMQRVELRNREISLLSRMAGALHSVNAFDECFMIIGRFAEQLFPRNAGCMFLYHPSHDVLEEVAHWCDWPAGLELFEPNQCWALRRGQSHQVVDARKELICPHLQHNELLHAGYLCVPLMAQGEPLGVLTLRGTPSVDLELAETFAEQVSLAVANLSLRESLRKQSVIDALTGLHNRRFLDESLRRELLRASRNQSSLAVVLLDVDHFKRFNDSFGHEAGDLVLRHLALEMKRQVRASDLACRYGGEEFALIMPEIGLDDAVERCEALRQAVMRLQVHYGGQALGAINISLGLAMFPQDGEEAEGLLHAADSALYEAKRSGRNRLCVYQVGLTSKPVVLT